ncbi:MAG TPA: RHS repeat-associated core domain-containing protein [Syntrophales bacterium]|nr:RHS repeat-associated core domain-containing protein [Syntrophales bacterium]
MPQNFEFKEAYNYFGPAYPNGVTAAYTYNNRGELTGLVYTDSSSAVIDTFAYTLDNVGNRLTKTDNEYQYAYTYDPVYRLTQSKPTQVAQNPVFQQTAESFSYDAVGNRLTGPVYEKDASYTQSYAYDFDNRLVSVTRQVSGNPNPDVITFKYDPFGRRVEKNVSTYENGLPITYNYVYVYDNEDIILEVLTRTQDGNSTITPTAYTHGPGIDEPLSMIRDGQTYYYHADGLGSITSMTDSTQSAVNRYAYDSFGAIKASETVRNAYAFTGREFDSETGLYFYRARYYDPEAGRFIGKDPIGFAGRDVNLFGYVHNRPTKLIDPYGFSSLDYNSGSGILTVYDKCGNQVGQFPAGNNTTSDSNGPWPPGTYKFSHYMPHPESGPTGPFGSYGNFVFDVPGRTGMGVHSGRNGPQSRTQGCIRTTDDATRAIRDLHAIDPLTIITVR